MLHSLVAPVIILAASTCTASSCFFVSVEQLSHTESDYSSTDRIKDKYMRSRAVRFILNLKLLFRFIISFYFYLFIHLFLIYSFRFHLGIHLF